MGCFFLLPTLMNEKTKLASESFVSMTEMILPNDTNPLNNLMGGRLMHLMDIAAAISAQRHSNRIVVTASVDNISFNRPIPLGNVITLNAQVTRAFSSSMEVFVEVFAEDIPKNTKFKSHEAFLTFVAVDQSGQPIPIPKLIPESIEQKKLYEEALQRRELRLVAAGKLDPNQSQTLKNLLLKKFDPDTKND